MDLNFRGEIKLLIETKIIINWPRVYLFLEFLGKLCSPTSKNKCIDIWLQWKNESLFGTYLIGEKLV